MHEKQSTYIPMTQGIDFLNSLASKGINPTLDNVQSFWEKCRIKPSHFIVTVAGTNGKGSTVGFLTKIFSECGYRTGSFISPHIQRINERILLNGMEISDEDFNTSLLHVKKRMEETGITLTFFEAILFAALFFFQKENVEIAIMEVGLGGRFDAVNVLSHDISVITSISFDHQNLLGSTLEAIASEKFAIAKEGNSVIANLSNEKLKQQLRGKTEPLNADLLLYQKDFFLRDSCYSFKDDISFPLTKVAFGDIQWVNISLALTSYYVFLQKTGKPEQRKKVVQAVGEFSPPGRFQKVNNSPQVFIDVAHNEDSFENLLTNVEEAFMGKKKVLLAAFSADKNWQPFVRKSLHAFDMLFFSRYNYHRTESTENIQEFVESLSVENKDVRYFQSVHEAKKVLHGLGDNYAAVVCGSFHTLDDYLKSQEE